MNFPLSISGSISIFSLISPWFVCSYWLKFGQALHRVLGRWSSAKNPVECLAELQSLPSCPSILPVEGSNSSCSSSKMSFNGNGNAPHWIWGDLSMRFGLKPLEKSSSRTRTIFCASRSAEVGLRKSSKALIPYKEVKQCMKGSRHRYWVLERRS